MWLYPSHDLRPKVFSALLKLILDDVDLPLLLSFGSCSGGLRASPFGAGGICTSWYKRRVSLLPLATELPNELMSSPFCEFS